MRLGAADHEVRAVEADEVVAREVVGRQRGAAAREIALVGAGDDRDLAELSAISSSWVGRNMRTAMSDSRSSRFSTESEGTSSIAMAGNSRRMSAQDRRQDVVRGHGRWR